MRLVEKSAGAIHLSHFMHLVSAYEASAENAAWLWNAIQAAKVEAKREERGVIVEQDCLDFFFVVYPSGALDLCARLRSYETETDEPE